MKKTFFESEKEFKEFMKNPNASMDDLNKNKQENQAENEADYDDFERA